MRERNPLIDPTERVTISEINRQHLTSRLPLALLDFRLLHLDSIHTALVHSVIVAPILSIRH